MEKACDSEEDDAYCYDGEYGEIDNSYEKR
jgi:hypothetical protein